MVVKLVCLVQWVMLWMLSIVVGQFDVQIDGDFVNIVEQCSIGNGGGLGFGLGCLVFGIGIDGQQMGLLQFQVVGDDFQVVVEYVVWVGMVMCFGGWEGLDQFGIVFQGCVIQGGELFM